MPSLKQTPVETPVLGQFRNPVYAGYLGDPFVWKAGREFYAIGTGGADAAGTPHDRVFPILRSTNLQDWTEAGRALIRLSPAHGTHYWAPEVAFSEGRFYLYYSVGFEDKKHHLRVAVSDDPAGPYQDTGKTLTENSSCPFAIDPHPFQDHDGQWYLFYARDFLDCQEGCRPGTALVVDRLNTMTELAGTERTVLRARCDWQRFMRERAMYGQTYDWHTLEGPFVRSRQGKYFCFYSGGRWETEDYGVDYGVADRVLGPYSDEGGREAPRVLRTIPGRLIGPGHNSVVTGPDGQEFMVYHAWNREMTLRQMHISPLLWTSDGPRVVMGERIIIA